MKRKLKALTLVEVLVASLILAISIVGTMSMFTVNHRIVANNYRFMLAEEIVRNEFERINKMRDLETEIIPQYGYMITQYTGSHHSAAGQAQTFSRDSIDFTLEFHATEIPVAGSYISQPVQPFILQIEAVIRWDGGVFTLITAV